MIYLTDQYGYSVLVNPDNILWIELHAPENEPTLYCKIIFSQGATLIVKESLHTLQNEIHEHRLLKGSSNDS